MSQEKGGESRRGFLKQVALVAATAPLGPGLLAAAATGDAGPNPAAATGRDRRSATLR